MSSTFDFSAELYNASIPPLPEKYIQLIQTCFDLKEYDNIIDLGCGSGTLALALTRFSLHIQGLDASSKMLESARVRDAFNRVQWIHSNVEEFDFGRDLYKLIMSFEAFHLFVDARSLIKKCAKALKPGGYLCVGWVNFEWEIFFKDAIIAIFKAHNIGWEDWNYWSCPGFPVLVKEADAGLSEVVNRRVEVAASTNIRTIASYLVSIERAASLGENEKQCLMQELEDLFGKLSSAGWSSGTAFYSLAYCRKDD